MLNNHQLMKQVLYLCFLVIIVWADHSADGWEYISPPISAEKFVPFPKIIWTSWDTGLDNAMTFTKLCLNNMNHFAKQSGFELRFVTNQNYTQFLSAESNNRMAKILDPKNKIEGSGKSDIMRAFLMYENGGIWTDIHSYFVQNLSWVKNLYKTPGVYNRFFPNPSVLLFTKNKNYSGNKTKIFDEKLQQQVYLFPGMENWFTIAKPKSEFYTDVIDAIERYYEVGRNKILKESQNLGIKFGSELNEYFSRGSFQLQYVLQKKQKQLDASKEPQTKYAVQYYKIWFMYAQYTGFVLRSHLSDDQELSFPFQYSQQMLGRLYGFPVQPHFIKNTGWKAVTLNRQLNSHGYKFSCQNVPNFIQPQSFIYTHLINITSMFKEVDQLKQTFSFFQGKCNPLAQNMSNIQQGFLLVKTIIFVVILSIPTIGMIDFIWKRIKRGSYQRIKLNDDM